MKKSKGITFLKKALQFYEVEGGAEGGSIYRDAITDLLHLYKEDVRIPKNEKDNITLLSTSHSNFLCEKEDEELQKIARIKTKDLPIYLNKTWDFPSGNDYFRERVCNELANESTSSPNRPKTRSC